MLDRRGPRAVMTVCSVLPGASSSHVQLLLGTGLCGALTTCSTSSYETLRPAEDRAKFFAAANAVSLPPGAVKRRTDGVETHLV
ncbi:fluoride efflux transporter FluC [Streptomyces sp. NPDC058442]|uniref:fluoride efflux transporter FluC n=1 Tax=Streptomyces sp. NPDC058442 TaxID=3346503 RepID=UPI0036645C5D